MNKIVINPSKNQRKKVVVTKPFYINSVSDVLSNDQADKFILSLSEGSSIVHKAFGKGVITELDNDTAKFSFENGKEAVLNLSYAVKKGIITERV